MVLLASDYCPLQWWKLNSVHLPMWSKVATFTYYSSIIPDARTYLLFPKLCQHNNTGSAATPLLF